MISGDYNLKYRVRNSLHQSKCIYVALLNIKRFVMISCDYTIILNIVSETASKVQMYLRCPTKYQLLGHDKW